MKTLTPLILVLLLCTGAVGDCPYSKSLNITAPKTLEALSGSCLLVPCSFTPDPKPGLGDSFTITKPVTGIWGKNHPYFHSNPNFVVFNSRDHRNKYNMNITGNLTQNNCTTVFYNVTPNDINQYFFRIENSGFKATATCDPVSVRVKESPWSPSIQLSGLQKEREVVTLTCSAVTPCPLFPPKLTWDTQQPPPVAMETHTNGTVTARIQQSLTLSERHDGVKITCSAVYPVSGGQKTEETYIILNVTYSRCPSVSVSPSQSLTEGQLVTMNCSSKANPPITLYRWFRVTSEGPVHVHEGDFYKFFFNTSTQGQYICETENAVGKRESSPVHLQLQDATTLKAAVGGSIGLLMLICVSVFVWCFISKCRAPESSKVRYPTNTVKEQEVLPPCDTDKPRWTLDAKAEEAAEAAEDGLYYGEITFLNLKPKVCCSSEPEETVYSQIKVNSEPAAQDAVALYAKIKR